MLISPDSSPNDILRIFNVSRESSRKLHEYVKLLSIWQKRINLVGPREIDRVWPRHIADGLQLLDHIDKGSRCAIDLGSGGGIPGIIVSAAIERPGYHVHLVESSHKKAAFLRKVIRELELGASVHACRIEALDRPKLVPQPDLVLSRALAPLDVLVEYIEPFVKNGAQTLLHKGQDVDSELTKTTKCWIMQSEQIPNRTNASGCILNIKDVRRVDSQHISQAKE